MNPIKKATSKRILLGVFGVALAVTGGLLWLKRHSTTLVEGIAMGNGRIEATQVVVATKVAGRVAEVLVKEGEYVTEGQIVARMDSQATRALWREAKAQVENAKHSRDTAVATVNQRIKAKQTAEAVVVQRESDLNLAHEYFTASRELLDKRAIPQQQFDSDQDRLRSAAALLAAARSQVEEAGAAIEVARAQSSMVESTIASAMAMVERVEVDLAECELKAPRNGRVQHRLVEPSEILGAGGPLLVVVDLSDVHMTVFLSERDAGRLPLGAEARLVLDAAPDAVLPARVSYVASEAQFTPKTIETASERQKLVFEVKLQLEAAGLAKCERYIKSGLPGIAYALVDSRVEWPANLSVKWPDAQVLR